ncbi:MAG: hypothetical protein Q9186_006191 [Xanthomendoza sp. 1 TL-2023]
MDFLPVANLLTIDAGRLNNGDQEEAAKLFQATKDDGVFYLDFQDSVYAEVLHDVDELFAFAKDLFALSAEEKLVYDIDKLDGESKLNGYKPVGGNIGGLSGGSDGFESFAIPGKRPIDASLGQLPLLASKYSSLTDISIRIRQISCISCYGLSLSRWISQQIQTLPTSIVFTSPLQTSSDYRTTLRSQDMKLVFPKQLMLILDL